MVDIILYSVGGFLAALALALMAMPFFSRREAERAVRRLHETMPFSTAEVEAQKDQLKAEHAVKLRKVELEAEKNSEIVGRQKIELRTIREKLEGANKIMKANKLAIEEMHEKQDELNEKLRHNEAKYASLDQRARQAIREKNEYQLQVKRLEKKNITTPKVVPGTISLQDSPELSASGLPIADASIALHPTVEAQLESLKKKLADERSRADKLTVELNELTRSQKNRAETPSSGSENDNMDVLREKLFSLAADISVVTAKLEGDDSAIYKILENEEPPSTLSERIKTLLDKTSEDEASDDILQMSASELQQDVTNQDTEQTTKNTKPEPKKPRKSSRKKTSKPSLPKAEGLNLGKSKQMAPESTKPEKTDDALTTQEKDAEETPA